MPPISTASARSLVASRRSGVLLVLVTALLQPSLVHASEGGAAVAIWLSGNYRERPHQRQAWTALLGVTIAFDKLSQPVIPKVSSRTGLADPTADVKAEPVETKASAGVDPAQQLGASQQRSPLHWQLSVAFVQAAVRAALSAHKAAEHDARLSSLRTRSRSSAALPELRLGAGRATDRSIRLSPTIDDPYRYTEAGGADLWLEARLSWRLDRLLFAREELAIERLHDAHQQLKWKRALAVVDALFAWQKALVEAEDPASSLQEQVLAGLRAARQAALVDALTGGWFFEHYPSLH